MRRWCLFLLMLAGVGGFTALVVRNGLGAIAAGIAAIGYGLPAMVAIRLVALALAGGGWALLLRRAGPARLATCLGLRIIREAINCLLPVAQVGGDLIGARLLARTGIGFELAGASVLVDLLLQVVTQSLFAALGLILLWQVAGDTGPAREAGATLLVAVPALAGFYLVQRIGLFAALDRAGGWAARRWPVLEPAGRFGLQRALDLVYGDRPGLALAMLLHFLAWLVGVAEIKVALAGLGHPSALAECVVLESLGQAVRSAGFVVPAALGIQEGGFVVLGALFGLPAPAALALSIAKRLPDFAVGLPGVAAWQLMEMPRRRTGKPR